MRRSQIYINASMFPHSWSSFIYRSSEYKDFYESLQIAFPNNVPVSQFHGCILVCSIDIYLDASLSTVSMGCNTQVICHFWNGLRPFEHNDSVRLQQQVIHLYIFEYSLIIMVKARWLPRQCIWSGQIWNLHIYLWSAHHSTEERGGVSRAH